MREYTIIMPRDAGYACGWLRSQLIDQFGGYTEHDATGAWKDATGAVVYDDNAVFTVASDAPHAAQSLRWLARIAGRIGEQDCVYFRPPSGEVEFINTAEVK